MKLKVLALKKLAKINNYTFKSVEIEGTTFEYDELKDGSDIWTVDSEGVVGVPEDGNYTIEDKKVKIEGGIISLLDEQPVEDNTMLKRLEELESVVTDLLVIKEEFKLIKEKLSKPVVEPEKKTVSQLSKFGLK